MSGAVLLLAHGTPDSLDQMEDYLTRVRGGRPPSPALVEEMRSNYAAIGGRSPLTDITRAQARALEEELGGVPVLVGMRNWSPTIGEALRAAERAGWRDLVAIPLAPQYSTVSVAKYRQAAEAEAPSGLRLRFVESWHEEPDLLEAFAEKLRAADPARERSVVFTAHSLPRRIVEGGDPYAGQVAATAAGVAARASRGGYTLAWQSAGRTEEPWLVPTLEQELSRLAQEGARAVVVSPIGFVCDHTEILFDIDVQARRVAAELGLDLVRTESLNTSPRLVAALAALVRRAWA